MSPFQKLFANGHSSSGLSDEVETAVNEVLREAEELCRLLRSRREARGAFVPRSLQREDGA
jgi:hypothetical protein